MPGHDVIVIGASAGGVEAACAVVAGLPADLPAAVCVVIHMRPFLESHLPKVLARCGPLRAVAVEDGMVLRPGVVHVAVPDVHMLVSRRDDHGVIRLVRGPRENRVRPAVDTLFRSAAVAFGPRVVGVVLSGALDDGTAGLWAIRDRGGIAVVQKPESAAIPSMPASAIAEAGADHVVETAELGPLLARLARVPAPPATAARNGEQSPSELVREVGIVAMDERTHQDPIRYGAPSRHVCPDCGGVLWDVSGTAGGPLRFRCETGHAYSIGSLEEAQNEQVETSLWAALRALEDRAELARRRGEQARERGLDTFAERFVIQEQAALQHAAALRALLRLDAHGGIRPRAKAAAR